MPEPEPERRGANSFSICYDQLRQMLMEHAKGHPQEDNLMHRWKAATLALSALLLLSETCCAQRELFARIKKVTEIPIWQRVPLGQKDFVKAIQNVQASDQKTMQGAIEQLALSRPQPAGADLVITLTQNAAKRSRDKFAMAMSFEIKRDWTEAKQAAEMLRAAQRSGGFRYLEQVIARGNASQVGAPMIAVAYSGNSRAAIVLTQNWRKSKIPGLRALLILGPPAADLMAKQLSDDSHFVVKDVIEVLGNIGNADHIPALKKTLADSNPIFRRPIEESIKKIEARAAAAESKSGTGKKKKK